MGDEPNWLDVVCELDAKIAELEQQLAAAAVARAKAAERTLAAVRATLVKPPMDGYTLASSILDILDRKGE